MKKFLFTLASLVAFGFAANAADPVMGFGVDNITEITLSAGQEQEVPIAILNLGGDAIKGIQMNFEMLDPNGELVTSGVHLQYLEKYGNPEKFAWFGGVGYTVENGNGVSTSNSLQHQTDAWDSDGDYMPGNPYGVEANPVYTGKYRVILANVNTGMCYPSRGQVYPQDILVFTVKVDEGWEDEYADFTMVKGDFSTTAGTKHCEFIKLRIWNGDYSVGPKELAGDIVIGDADENGYVTISYTGEEDVTIKVMVDGVYVPMTDGQIFLGAYGEAEVTVEVTAEGYEPKTATKTVNWEAPVLEDLTGQIVVSEPTEDGKVTVTYTGEEEVTITVNGEPYEGEIQLEEGENTLVVVVEAAGYNNMEETFVVTWTAPVVLEKTATPTIEVEEFDDAVVVTAVGDGTVILYCDGEVVENPCTIAKGEDAATYTFTATAQEEGKDISDVATEVVEVAAYVAPYETPAPTVDVDVQETQVVITATGEGTVILYVNGQPVENPYTIARTEEVQFVTVYATAQRDEESYAGISESQYVEIPALEVVQPTELTGEIIVSEPNENGIVTVTYTGEEEVTVTVTVNGEVVEGDVVLAEGENEIVVTVTAPGYEPKEETFNVTWTPGEQPAHTVIMIMIDANGNEVPYVMTEGANGDYTTTVALDYDTYGYVYYDANTEPVRHNVNYYFMIDGVRYGAPDAEVATVLGTALSNQLVEGEGFYTLPVGYNYNMGVAFSTTGPQMYVYAAQASFTGVNELNANKTVANVRYFNMAGQEMQQANGMTIVVTTYTDGTTSAVKVMK